MVAKPPNTLLPELFIAIHFTLQDMASNLELEDNRDTPDRALNYLKLISSFSFVIPSRYIFDLTLDVTRNLQAQKLDVIASQVLIETLKNVVMIHRNNIDFHHSCWYREAVSLATKVGIKEGTPRITGKQTCRENHPSSSTIDYYKKALTIPVLDHVNKELKTRFNSETIISYKGLVVVPAQMFSLICKVGSLYFWKDEFRAFTSFYEDDLPNPLALEAEMELWKNIG